MINTVFSCVVSLVGGRPGLPVRCVVGFHHVKERVPINDRRCKSTHLFPTRQSLKKRSPKSSPRIVHFLP